MTRWCRIEEKHESHGAYAAPCTAMLPPDFWCPGTPYSAQDDPANELARIGAETVLEHLDRRVRFGAKELLAAARALVEGE